jgi:ATP-dependent RNA helicase DeaD
MLCKMGDLEKDDIGAIRVQDTQSFVEIRNSAVAGFVAALGPDMQVEDDAQVTQLAEPPKLAARPKTGFKSKPRGNKPGHRGKRDFEGKRDHEGKRDRGPKRDFDGKPPARKPRKPEDPTRNGAVKDLGRKPRHKAADRAASDKPKGPPPPKGKPNSKKNRARAAAAADQKGKKGGFDAPRKSRKPKPAR